MVKRLDCLDLVRAFAMVYIIAIRHVDDYAHQLFHCKLDDLLTYALLGVFVFLSGYLLAFGNKINNCGDALLFYKKRFIRVYPLYLLALILFSVFLPDKLPPLSLFQHMLLANMFTGDSVITLWFVTMICVFYLLYPLLVYNYSTLKVFSITCVFFIILMASNITMEIIDNRLFIYLPLFTFGIVVARLNYMAQLRGKRVVLVSLFLAWGGGALFLAFQGSRVYYFIQPFYMFFAIPPMLYLANIIARIVPVNLYSKLAYASFCMYLFHRIVYDLLLKIYLPPTDITIICYLIIVGVPVLYQVSYFVQKYYDLILAE